MQILHVQPGRLRLTTEGRRELTVRSLGECALELCGRGPQPPGTMDVNCLDGRRSFVRVLQSFYLPADYDDSTVAAFYDALAPRYDSLIDQDFNRQLIARLVEQIVVRRDLGQLRVLDYGVGTALSAQVCRANSRIELHGADISPHMVERATIAGVPSALVASGGAMNFESRLFDGLFASNVVHYFRSPEPFRSWARVMKRGAVASFNVRLPGVRPSRATRKRYLGWLSESGFVAVDDELVPFVTTRDRYLVWILTVRAM